MFEDALARTQGPMMMIVGSGRSGTSLLATMMDSHPDLSVAPESHFLPSLIKALPETLTTSDQVARMVKRMGQSKWFDFWELDLDLLQGVLESRLPVSRPDALRMIYRVHAAQAGKTRFGEKTPAYVYNIPLIAAELEDARFIHIIRDGRNVALSFREADFGADDVAHSMLNWKLRVLDGHRDGMALGPDRYIEVVYEDLIAEPEKELRRLCEFLDLEYSDAMLDYHRKRADRRAGLARGADRAPNLSRPPTKTRDWRDQLTRAEHARLELLGAKPLRQWGYELTAKPTLSDRLAAFGDLASWYYYRLRSKTGMAKRARRGQTGNKGEANAD